MPAGICTELERTVRHANEEGSSNDPITKIPERRNGIPDPLECISPFTHEGPCAWVHWRLINIMTRHTARRGAILRAVLAVWVLVTSMQTAQSADCFPPVPVRTPSAAYPFNSVAWGMVNLLLVVSEEGLVSNVELLASIASLDEPAMRAARQWKFRPAGRALNGAESMAVVSFVFGLDTRSTPFAARPSQLSKRKALVGCPVPVELYPVNSTLPGVHSLEVEINERGEFLGLKVLHPAGALDEKAIRAGLKQWRFAPARENGKPIPSKLSLSFVYVPLPISELP